MDNSGSTHVDKISDRLVSEIMNVLQPFAAADCRNLMNVHKNP